MRDDSINRRIVLSILIEDYIKNSILIYLWQLSSVIGAIEIIKRGFV